MTTIRTIVVNDEPTVSFFTNLPNADTVVSSDVNSAVVGYFEPITGDKESARILAQAVMQTASANGLDIMEVLQEFRKKPAGELSRYTTMFLNLNRVGTSYLGLTNSPVVTDYIKRTVLP